MAGLLWAIPLAAAPRSEGELQTTLWMLMALVVAVGAFLWLVLARFSRPP